ncbi:GNAT family N-acetyltransferase [Peribacillus saganii]|uniref:GNAT family N-acetyltransferase n=1 Tax=Peribacillus saganii TaxID=2303992 RepID=A0A372LNT4_9BACI|nr:GNAT family N-acetyltransferase [Peribacillus saganii]RFU69356.1 GNAT family N-acetyltransferase [Peribacillus saganii]
MIRKLKMEDNEKVMAFLGEEPSINLFIIGDIEAFGYEAGFQQLWAQFDDNGEILAVLLNFYNSFIPYAKNDFDVDGFADIIRSFGDSAALSGKEELVEKFEGLEGLNLGKKQITFFAECRTAEHLGNDDLEVKKADISDIDRIIAIRETIEEFPARPDSRDMLLKAMETNTGRTYYIEENGEMIAIASTTAENSISAMIVGVCSRAEYRKKGLATAVTQKLVSDVLKEGKTLCLFYDNPGAGRIYKRLGFQDIGMWTMYR